MSDSAVMRFELMCTVFGCPSRMVFLLPVAGTASEIIQLSRKYGYAHGWRADRIGTLCPAHVDSKVGKLKATT